MKLKTITAEAIANKTVIVRVDYNVPLDKDTSPPTIENDRRIRDSLETVQFLLKNDAKIILMAHLGRPKSAEDTQFSLLPIANHLEELLKHSVTLLKGEINKETKALIEKAPAKSIFMLENLRFYPEEKKNSASFAKSLADLANVYVNEAFSVCHRSHASVVGVPEHLPAYAGFNLVEEVNTLSELIEKPKKPFVAVLGGAKISDKVGAITNLTRLADIVLIGGAIANNFLKAEGFEIYRSFLEEKTNVKDGPQEDYTAVAAQLIDNSKTERVLKDGYIPLPKLIYPIDVIAAPSIETTDQSKTKELDLSHDMADREEHIKLVYADIGPKTLKLYTEILADAGTIFWNGPMGVWENEIFSKGTKLVAKAITESKAHTVLGGGDTIAAARHFNYIKDFDYVSTAGGAALEFLGGDVLPGIEPLLKK